ncbi:MAG: cytochrome c [Bacteroidales bacterium]|nr:cytochrome c [Bacteroidales bacterium]
MKIIILKISVLILICLPISDGLTQTSGKQVFRNKGCAGCHTINEGKLIGPDLANITEKRNRKWLINFIRSPKKMIDNGDTLAVRLYNKYNKVMMPANDMTDEEIKNLLDFIAQKSSEKTNQQNTKQKSTATAYNANNFSTGKQLFTGELLFMNYGPSCISCHDIKNMSSLHGGMLAKDLSTTYKRLGDRGIRALLKNPAFPVMKEAYRNKPLTKAEIHNLTAFLKKAAQKKPGKQTAGVKFESQFIIVGLLGAGIFILVISLIWLRRKKHSVNDEIYERQLRTE